MNTHQLPSVLAFLLAGFVILGTANAKKTPRNAPRPKPDLADVHYGPHVRNVLDLWQAKSDQPAPLVFYIHEQMDQLDIECTIRHADEKADSAQEMNDFFVKHLLGGK